MLYTCCYCIASSLLAFSLCATWVVLGCVSLVFGCWLVRGSTDLPCKAESNLVFFLLQEFQFWWVCFVAIFRITKQVGRNCISSSSEWGNLQSQIGLIYPDEFCPYLAIEILSKQLTFLSVKNFLLPITLKFSVLELVSLWDLCLLFICSQGS